jgi:hypothetical protein
MKAARYTIIFSSRVATLVADAHEESVRVQPNLRLKGAVRAATSNEFYHLDSNSATVETDNIYAVSSDKASYTYQFQLDLSSPLSINYVDGTPKINQCINWDPSVSSTNFTWYGFSFQLPDDASEGEGGWNNAPAQPLKEDGLVQLFNDTYDGVATYNFTTSADTPVIRARINNGLFWNTFTFDFTDGTNYVEQKSTQSVMCIVKESDDGNGKLYTTVATPTVTVSLERLSAHLPPPPSSSTVAGSFFAFTALASSTLLLLL